MTSRIINRVPNKTCDYCGEGFYIAPKDLARSKTTVHFCSQYHRSLYLHKPNVECSLCHKPIWRSPSIIAKSKNSVFFCGKEHQAIGLAYNSKIPVTSGPIARNPADPETIARRERSSFLKAKCKHCPQYRVFSKLVEGCCNNCILIELWLRGEASGTSSKTNEISMTIVRYMKRLRGEQCWECGWCEVNPTTGRIPVEVDHIDGNSGNNHISNLRVLCPNHHSLTPTYGNNGYRAGKSGRINRYRKFSA